MKDLSTLKFIILLFTQERQEYDTISQEFKNNVT